jgi:hypothetical protein
MNMDNPGRNDWLVSPSLERSLDIISAINRVSIHSKLHLAGMEETAKDQETEDARKTLTRFLSTLSDLIEKAEGSEDKIAFGADPRLSSLARKFLSNPAEVGGTVFYRPEELKELKVLLEEGDATNLKELVEGLAHLRSVLEQHAQADAAIVFNEV